MIKCYVCKKLRSSIDNKKHVCAECKGKIVFGEIQAPFIEHCSFFETEKERKRAAAEKRMRRNMRVYK